MQDRIYYLITSSGVINLVVDNKSFLIEPAHINYEAIKEALKTKDADQLLVLTDLPKSIVSYSQGKIEIRDGELFYNGEVLHNTITDRIFRLKEEGLPFEPMVLFLENLLQNPSYRAVNELYEFLEHKGLPITEDGHFIAYKGIRADWKDKYTGIIDNSIGQKLTMTRSLVDDNRARVCSVGYHAGTLHYVKGYCTERVVLVKINPADVVSVPADHNAEKVRVCQYEVIAEYAGNLDELPDPVYYTEEPEEDYEGYGYDEDYEEECDCPFCRCD